MKKEEKDEKKVFEIILSWELPLLLFFAWNISAALFHSNAIFPSPITIIERAAVMVRNGQLAEFTWATVSLALTGFFIGGGIGILLGLLNGMLRLTDISLSRTIRIFSAIPILAILSYLIICFGMGEKVNIIIVSLSVFFPIYTNTYLGIKSVDNDLIEMGKVYGLKGFNLFKEIIYPGALASIFVGIRLSLTTMWLIIIAIEMVAANTGIGYMAMTARDLMQTDQVVLSIIIYTILYKLSDVIVTRFEQRVLTIRR